MFYFIIKKFKFSFFIFNNFICNYKIFLFLYFYLVSIQLTECFNNEKNIFSIRTNATSLRRRNIGFINPIHIEYTRNDLYLITRFLNALKDLNGDWSKHGLQHIIRLNSECSQSYVSLRSFRIKADVPIDEAFKDPYTQIEKLVYRKFSILKSKQLGKYVCYHQSGVFILKSLNDLDKFCVFNHHVRAMNAYQFSLGSNQKVYLSFNKFGRLINPLYNKQINQNECKNNQSQIFYIHTKLTDVLSENNYVPIIFNRYAFFHTTTSTSTSTPTTTTKNRSIYKPTFDSVVVASTQAIPVPPTTTAVISSPNVPELVNPTPVPKFTSFSNQSGTEFSFNGSPVQFNNPFNETVSKRRVGKPIIQSTSAFDRRMPQIKTPDSASKRIRFESSSEESELTIIRSTKTLKRKDLNTSKFMNLPLSDTESESDYEEASPTMRSSSSKIKSEKQIMVYNCSNIQAPPRFTRNHDVEPWLKTFDIYIHANQMLNKKNVLLSCLDEECFKILDNIHRDDEIAYKELKV
ncbi:unnamed protein product [Brachionus calyciflorus]|uniref:Uncharacterized protein n=1 Tax=Brachionus calyciflorus TaxID=104777 RepID=A0A813UME3_9BILA|nr:unnamed protein product [Brachionus calyciflorus]